MRIRRSSLAFAILAVACLCGCSENGNNNPQPQCPAQVPNSCGQPTLYCTTSGQCVACAAGTLNCDGDNTNLCEATGASCNPAPCAGCAATDCCHEGTCVPFGQPCGTGGLTCKGDGTCAASSICGNVSCSPPSCCYQDVCYDNAQPCGSSGLTCNSGTCGAATSCGGVACGAPSCCRLNVCYQDGQSCGGGLVCKNGSCQGTPCGGVACDLPSCCFNEVCLAEGQACGSTEQKCAAGICAVPSWSCTQDPGGGPFSTVHSDGCRWKWTCPTEGKYELFCETISSVKHDCSCKKDGVEERRFESVPICSYDAKTIATQANADCKWNLPTP